MKVEILDKMPKLKVVRLETLSVGDLFVQQNYNEYIYIIVEKIKNADKIVIKAMGISCGSYPFIVDNNCLVCPVEIRSIGIERFYEEVK